MRLPDAEGFVIAARRALEGYAVVYLHDAEGAVCARLVPPRDDVEDDVPKGMQAHARVEPDMGEEVPWADLLGPAREG